MGQKSRSNCRFARDAVWIVSSAVRFATAFSSRLGAALPRGPDTLARGTGTCSTHYRLTTNTRHTAGFFLWRKTMSKPDRRTCVAFWSPPDLTAKLDAAARAEGVSRADVVRRAAIASVSKPHDVTLTGESLLAAIAARVVAGCSP